MSFDDQDRDLFGNVRTTTHDQFEGHRAGVTEYDTAESARHKVEQQRERDRLWYPENGSEASPYASGSSWNTDTGGLMGKFALIFLVGCLVIGALITVIDGFSKGRANGMKEIAEQRLEKYSDFSTPDQWPKAVQSTIMNNERASLESVFRALPSDPAKYSIGQQARLGAKIWFPIAAKGERARQYVDSAKRSALSGRKWFDEKPLVLAFLRSQCAQGVEAGCLDAAKVQASNVFDLPDYITEEVSDKKALAELPTTGELAKSPAITNLRAKISQGVNQYDWAHLKYKVFQFGR